jgi:hypothetical protein
MKNETGGRTTGDGSKMKKAAPNCTKNALCSG